MTDKAFNELPMVTVVSDALDPRTKRQLQAQLQSELKTISEVDAEIKNAESMESIKQQYDTAKDTSKFDDIDTQESKDPTPIENNEPKEEGGDNGNDAEDAFSDTPDAGQDGGGDAQQNEASAQPAPAQEQSNDANGATPPDANAQQPAEGNGDAGQAPAPAQASNASDAFDGGDAQPAQQQQQPAPAQQPAQPAQPAPAPAGGNNQDQGNTQGQDGDDPFSDGGPSFESFAGILGIPHTKLEDAEVKQTPNENLPPMKQLTYIRGTDHGVDNRTSAVIAAMEDPENTVVVLDLSDVGDAEPKMQYQSVKKQLQERGITVVDTVDEAVEYLNDVYDQIAGKSK